MSDLLDRLGRDRFFLRLPTTPQKIKLHQFVANLRLYADSKMEAAQIYNSWKLSSGERVQVSRILSTIDDQADLSAKLDLIDVLEATLYLLEDDDDRLYHDINGRLNRELAKRDLGI
jgi:hypothetical protein